MTSFLKSVFKTFPVSASNQPTLSSLSVTVHPLTEFEEMSTLSTTSVVTALEQVGRITHLVIGGAHVKVQIVLLEAT
jgi:hypothetical protein